MRLFFSNKIKGFFLLSHSKNSIFLRADNNRLVTIVSGSDKYPNPYTAVFSDGIPLFFRTNEHFTCKNGILNGKERITLNAILKRNLFISDINIKGTMSNNIAIMKVWLMSQTISGMNEILNEQKTIFSEYLSPYLNHLKISWKDDSPDGFYNTLSEISGSGQGLTPASDDFIMGIIYTLNILVNSGSIHPKWRVSVLYFLRKIKYKTTELSFNLIKLCLLGFCSNWQKNIFKGLGTCLNSSEFDKIDYGNSSGRDLLTGVYFILSLYSEGAQYANLY